ncbi:hypothetical protein BDN72DRAFT_149789 [Pluteus cervinus]|uniref:Uncharacterized protein n=1 Tax=Pluteus cervinus TaxID=181527 RepID=A0ACD3B7M7_9AGAR|nr:hypothetical protein BDN72DRAFT_149789 [Pluteus cervinus]
MPYPVTDSFLGFAVVATFMLNLSNSKSYTSAITITLLFLSPEMFFQYSQHCSILLRFSQCLSILFIFPIPSPRSHPLPHAHPTFQTMVNTYSLS